MLTAEQCFDFLTHRAHVRAALHLRWPVMKLNTRPKEALNDPSKYKSAGVDNSSR